MCGIVHPPRVLLRGKSMRASFVLEKCREIIFSWTKRGLVIPLGCQIVYLHHLTYTPTKTQPIVTKRPTHRDSFSVIEDWSIDDSIHALPRNHLHPLATNELTALRVNHPETEKYDIKPSLPRWTSWSTILLLGIRRERVHPLGISPFAACTSLTFDEPLALHPELYTPIISDFFLARSLLASASASCVHVSICYPTWHQKHGFGDTFSDDHILGQGQRVLPTDCFEPSMTIAYLLDPTKGLQKAAWFDSMVPLIKATRCPTSRLVQDSLRRAPLHSSRIVTTVLCLTWGAALRPPPSLLSIRLR